MRWRTITLIAVGAMIALSVLSVFRQPHYDDKTVKPPSALIKDQCASTPGGGLMAPEYTCEKP
jgi:hypothetical protein